MKLKYYLRGVGIGIIFATLVLTVSSIVHENNPSKELIIREAKKLGMIMPENTEEDLWGTQDESKSDEDNSPSTENQPITSESENVIESENTSESETTSEGDVPEGTLVTITINRGDYARQVGQMLYDNGLVDDAEKFRVYLGDMGYGNSIRVGTFQIPMGATYEEICNIIIVK